MRGTRNIASSLGGLFLVSVILGPLGATAAQDAGVDANEYHEDVVLHGQLGCEFAYSFVQTGDHCQQALPFGQGPLDPNAESTFRTDMAAGLTGLVVYLRGDHALLPGHADLRLDWLVPVGGIPRLAGPTPLLATYTFDAENDPWTTAAHDAQLSVRSNPDSEAPVVAYQVKLTICLGLFYGGHPVPAEYHPCPEKA